MGFFGNVGIGIDSAIKTWANYHNIKNYIINSDHSIDIYDETVYFVHDYNPLKYKINKCKKLSFKNCEIISQDNFPDNIIDLCLDNTILPDINKLIKDNNINNLQIFNYNNLNIKLKNTTLQALTILDCNNCNISIINSNINFIEIIKCDKLKLNISKLYTRGRLLAHNVNLAKHNIKNSTINKIEYRNINIMITHEYLRTNNIINKEFHNF